MQPNWVTLERAAILLGYTLPTMRGRIREGVWPESVVWCKRHGRIMINLEAHDRWVEGQDTAA